MLERMLDRIARAMVRLVGVNPIGEALCYVIGGPGARLEVYLEPKDEEDDDEDDAEPVTLDRDVWGEWADR